MPNNIEVEFEKWFKELSDSLSYLLMSRYFFKEFMNIVDNNPKLPNNNPFIVWIWENYLYNASIHLRRLVDHKPKTYSFYNFLKKVKEYPFLFSRERYISEFTKDNGFTKQEADSIFSNIFGNSFNKTSQRAVNKDITCMDKKYEPLRDYVNSRIAHSSNRSFKRLPKIGDLHDCIDYLEKLFNKYYALHNAASYSTLLPTIQFPWAKIFKLPWVLSP